MFVNVDEYVRTLVRLDMTPEQYALCHLLAGDKMHRSDRNRKLETSSGSGMANVYRYAQKRLWDVRQIQQLIDRGWLITLPGMGPQIQPDFLEVTDAFVKEFLAGYSDFEEFYSAYPSWVANFHSHNGPRIPLKIADRDKLAKTYTSAVDSKALHRKVVDAVLWAREKEMINMNIEKFILSRGWELLIEAMEEAGPSSARYA